MDYGFVDTMNHNDKVEIEAKAVGACGSALWRARPLDLDKRPFPPPHLRLV